MQIKDITDVGTETARYKALLLVPLVPNGVGTHRFAPNTVTVHYTDTDPTILILRSLLCVLTSIHMFLVLCKLPLTFE